MRPNSGDWTQTQTLQQSGIERAVSDTVLPSEARLEGAFEASKILQAQTDEREDRSESAESSRPKSPPALPVSEAVDRAKALSKKLTGSNIPAQVTDKGDVMLDMTGYKSSEDQALHAEVVARKILAEEIEGNYDIGALIGADEDGNLWIYSSEEAKEEASRKAALRSLGKQSVLTSDAASDPGYQTDEDAKSVTSDAGVALLTETRNNEAEAGEGGLATPPHTPPPHNGASSGDPNRNYAKTLRLTSDQLHSLELKPGPNEVSFTVNRATCEANIYLWKNDVPIVISDIDGTITK
jgi:phosphatidate phosphatase LPIN